jgi:lipoprotein-anchoring transpeptidase ErfK/SrfK
MLTAPQGFQKFFAYSLAMVMVGLFVGLATHPAEALTSKRASEIQIGTSSTKLPVLDGKYRNGLSIAAADVNGDGIDEFVVGAAPGGTPLVQVLDQSGAVLSSWLAYDKSSRAGVHVAAGDLDADGLAEIVTGQLTGASPEVRVYTWNGTLIRKFTAFESSYSGGISVGVIPSYNGNAGEIIVGSLFGREAEVRVFDQTGSQTLYSFAPLGTAASNGVTVAGGWSAAYGEPIIVVGNGQGQIPLVQTYGLTSKKKVGQWLAYDKAVKSGLAVAMRNDVVMTSPMSGGGPDVRTFTLRGVLQNSFIVFEKDFRGGLNIAITSMNGALTAAVVPTTEILATNAQGKKIVVSLKQQKMTLYENGRVVSIRRVSTGKWATPTPVGTFAVKNKIPVAYSKAYGLYMENWMAFSPDGRYGLHSLPFWKLRSGGRLYEGAAHIGTPVSHGCVRQTLAESKTLYNWATIGTPVIIQT